MRNMRSAALSTLAAMLLAVTACGDDSPDPVVGPGASVPLRLASVSPSVGGIRDNTRISLSGTGFQQGATLTVGGLSLALTVFTSTTASTTVPPHGAGPVDIVITNPNGERSQLTEGFRYIDTPVKVEITGNVELRAVGDTSQLTATATHSDGTVADVTRETRWVSSLPWIASISSAGLVTSLALGVTQVHAQYPANGPSVSDREMVTATPAGTFALVGRVREPGAGAVASARVEHIDTGQAVNSNQDGYFWFGGLTGRPAFRFTKVGYEDAEPSESSQEFFDAPMQRVVHLPAGAETYSSRLAPNDLRLTVADGTECQPCRAIRVRDTTPGVVQMTLNWSGPETLAVWVKERRFEAPDGVRAITAAVEVGDGDTIVYVGRVRTPAIPDYINFTVVVRR